LLACGEWWECSHARKIRQSRSSKPTPDQLSRAVRAASNAVPGTGNCLVNALAAEAMLGRLGYDCNLRIGVSKAAFGQFKAHAWLESGGKVPIGEFDFGRYRTLAAPEARFGS
jgi:Transglutaminase-like superfamily